jgi:hypothetical protein
MEFQQKGQQITLSRGVILWRQMGRRITMGKKYRGGTDVYGESIYTKRWELLGAYELPIAEKCCFHFLIRTTTKTPWWYAIPQSNALALGNWPGIKKLIIMICFLDCPPLPILRWTLPQQ